MCEGNLYQADKACHRCRRYVRRSIKLKGERWIEPKSQEGIADAYQEHERVMTALSKKRDPLVDLRENDRFYEACFFIGASYDCRDYGMEHQYEKNSQADYIGHYFLLSTLFIAP